MDYNIRNMKDDPDDCEFVGRMLYEAVTGEFDTLFPGSSLKTILQFATKCYTHQPKEFYKNVFLLSSEKEKIGFVEMAFHDTVKNQMSKMDLIRTFGVRDSCRYLLSRLFFVFPIVPSTAYIDNLAVEAKFRGQGYGRALLKRAEEEAVARRCNKIYCLVFSTNTDGMKFYEKNGYKAVGKPRTFYGFLYLVIKIPALTTYEKLLNVP
ncbi:uncharacterized protein LOC133196266 isoform X2 [Saccostrea echinata]|uniref:uncharacterized protein LOC133196266 isoform X2 n=1 Tax=Saccostrea echinata TaxID=191078 RepID=UPI002A7FC56C|nr:uncharacterized protein LOC133196266 isoform X2 [Saccostrea echinata]